jgi:phosphoribosylformylglycinamidine cyclo-ligase
VQSHFERRRTVNDIGKDPYAASGVDYSKMDPFKRACQEAARKTDNNSLGQGYQILAWTRGESVCVFQDMRTGICIGHVEEGLGTKNLVDDALYKAVGKTAYASIAQDTVAMIVNDMATLGVAPVSVAMHVAAGSADWFKDTNRVQELINGWKHACDLAECTWSGGETPTLQGIVHPSTCLLSGSAVGISPSETRLFDPAKIREGDAIVLLESSGIHANGLSFARKLIENRRASYTTKLPDGRTYGETLLDPTHIYVPFILDCMRRGLDIHYTVHITGHGWCKLMRAPQPFAYVIEKRPQDLPIFKFLRKQGELTQRDAYKMFNMGAGFAIYLPTNEVEKLPQTYPFKHFVAGYVEKSKRKKVVINPLQLEYDESDLNIR